MPIELTSPAFEDGGFIPVRYTSLGENVSPPLQWAGAPPETRTFALIIDETDGPDASRVHWVIFDLPAEQHELPEHVSPEERLPDGKYRAKQGRNDFGKIGYSGPVASRERPRRYTFTLYALDAVIHRPPGATKDELLEAMFDHVLDQARLTGLFSE